MSNAQIPMLVLAGRLEAIPLADVLQVLAAAQRDGVLSVEREDPPERGEIELVGGRLVRAEVSHLPGRISGLLLRRGALDAHRLSEALRRQSAAYPAQPLGVVLREMGAVAPQALAEAEAQEIQEHAAVMLGWRRGVFRFRASPPSGATPTLTSRVALEAGQVLLEAARQHDELARLH